MVKKLKLFVWFGVLTDYTPGTIAVMAASEAEAREKLKSGRAKVAGGEAAGLVLKEIAGLTPAVFGPNVWVCTWGGG